MGFLWIPSVTVWMTQTEPGTHGAGSGEAVMLSAKKRTMCSWKPIKMDPPGGLGDLKMTIELQDIKIWRQMFGH
jgi:hypothetical protein